MAADRICATCRYAEKIDFNPPWVQCHFKMPCHDGMPKYSKQTDTCDLWSVIKGHDAKPKGDRG